MLMPNLKPRNDRRSIERSTLIGPSRSVAPCVLAGLAIAVAAICPSALAQSFTALGFLPGGSDSNGWVSGDGTVVAGYCGTTSGHRAIRWTESGGMVSLGVLPLQTYSFGYGASSNGAVIVGYSGSIGGSDTAFRWENDVMDGLGVLPGANDSYAQAISGNGLVIVGDSRNFFAGISAAFRWTSGTGMEGLPTLQENAFSAAYGVNSDGSVIVGYSGSPNGDRACRWTGGGIQDLGALAGDSYSYAYGVSADGAVAFGYSGTGFVVDRAFRWTSGGGIAPLGSLAGLAHAVAFASNADGSVIVGSCYGDNADSYAAFLWSEPLGMVDLNTYLPTLGIDLTGWILGSAGSISSDGLTLSGIGRHNGHSEAWLARLGSTPCTGDLDSDGDVDLADLATLLSHFGTLSGATPADGDTDGDGDVDLGDLAALLSNYGTACP
jgi:probable HAF family extracellular repeat protein